MAKDLLSPATFVGTSLAGALLLAVYLGVVATRTESDAPEQRPQPRAALQAEPAVASLVPPPVQEQPQARQVAYASTCPAQAASPASGEGDGLFRLDAALSSGGDIDAGAFVSVAREAARQGRVRDAETALLAACHVAERRGEAVAVSELKAQIAALQQQGAVAPQLAAEGPATSVLGAARPSAAEESAAPPAPGDPRRLIRSDPELSQLERDMARLHAQAISVTTDPDGLRRRHADAAGRREACQDKACLLQWYAQRRRQLLEEF